MGPCKLADPYGPLIDAHAAASATRLGRGAANIEDQIRAVSHLLNGLLALSQHGDLAVQLPPHGREPPGGAAGDARAPTPAADVAQEMEDMLDSILLGFTRSVLAGERAIREAQGHKKQTAHGLLESFLMSFAGRTATRERLNVFTTNCDRLVEYGCDLAGLRPIDRFVGSLSPVFRSSRLNIDVHDNPPGIRGEPRYLEGVIRLTKLHGSLDWRWVTEEEDGPGALHRCPLPFGADEDHPEVIASPPQSFMVYPNPTKDNETLDYPYAELFRDFAAGLCRPNSSLVTYRYGFGDDHINRIIRDMLTIPSTHLVVIAWSPEGCSAEDGSRQRIERFCTRAGKDAQVSLLLGEHFGDLEILVQHYLPKPAIDPITERRAALVERRGEEGHTRPLDAGEGASAGKEAALP